MSKNYDYYCSCSQGKLKYESSNKHTKMIMTIATTDGLCVHCEHYAVACSTVPLYNGEQFTRDKRVVPKEMIIGQRL